MNRNMLMKVAKLVADAAKSGDYGKLLDHLRSLDDLSVGWKNNVDKFIKYLETGVPEYTIFTKGNSKLPFVSFSALPVYTCPGLGACAKWCYSFKAWRYPAAFFRQAQNTILVITQSDALTDAFNQLKVNVTIRLYVDGDFDSEGTLRYWMDRLHQRPDIQAYGYSKSLHLFRKVHDEGIEWPENYKLNLSSGGKFQAQLVEGVPVVRGQFVAVPIDRPAMKKGYGTSEYNAAVRESAEQKGYGKVFVCPGKCGTCTRKGHACGLDNFDGITIAIGIH